MVAGDAKRVGDSCGKRFLVVWDPALPGWEETEARLRAAHAHAVASFQKLQAGRCRESCDEMAAACALDARYLDTLFLLAEYYLMEFGSPARTSIWVGRGPTEDAPASEAVQRVLGVLREWLDYAERNPRKPYQVGRWKRIIRNVERRRGEA